MKQYVCPVRLDVLRPGDWFEMNFGYARNIFYVVRNDPVRERVWFSSMRWLSNDLYSVTYEVLRDEGEILDAYVPEHLRIGLIYLGRTKPRWWWRFVPWRELHCPFVPWKFK